MMGEPPENGKTKSAEMDDAINEINGVHDHASKLLRTITGRGGDKIPELPDKKESPKSLQSILDEGPERISNHCEEVHKLLDQITEALI